MSLCQKCRSIRIPKLNDAAADGDGDRGHYGEAKQHLENGGAVGSTVIRTASAGNSAMTVAEGCAVCGLVWGGLSGEQRDVVDGGRGDDRNDFGLEVGNGDEAKPVSPSNTNNRQIPRDVNLSAVKDSVQDRDHGTKTTALLCHSFPSPKGVVPIAGSADTKSNKRITTASGQRNVSQLDGVSGGERESILVRYGSPMPKTHAIEDLIDALNIANTADDAPPKPIVSSSQHQDRRHYPERRQQCEYNEWRELRLREMQASDPAWQQKRQYHRLVEEDLRRQWKKAPENPMIQAPFRGDSASRDNQRNKEEMSDDDDDIKAMLDRSKKVMVHSA